MNEKVTCIAKFLAKPGFEENLKNALHELIEPTRNETGCISYDMYERIGSATVFTMIEKFVDSDAIEFHSDQPYLANFKENAAKYIENFSVDLYKDVC